ncbi:MAG: hypothetical protein HYY24_11635 [Verrucomicrobia bacterium]|nr:hypothetical protein [Verrucomicrobiota bacterium]
MNSFITLLAAAAIAVGLSACSNSHEADDHSGHAHDAAGPATDKNAKPYPLSVCIVSAESFDHGKPYVFAHEGQEIKLCCKDCLKDFQNEPAKYLAKLKTDRK